MIAKKLLAYLPLLGIPLATAIINQIGYQFYGNPRPMFWLIVGKPFAIFPTVFLVIWWQWLVLLCLGMLFAIVPLFFKGSNPLIRVGGWGVTILLLLLYKPLFYY